MGVEPLCLPLRVLVSHQRSEQLALRLATRLHACFCVILCALKRLLLVFLQYVCLVCSRSADVLTDVLHG
jgi:hypothetical protein